MRKTQSLRGPKALKARPARKDFSRKSFKDNTFDKPKKVRSSTSRGGYANPKRSLGRRAERGNFRSTQESYFAAMPEEGSRMQKRRPSHAPSLTRGIKESPRPSQRFEHAGRHSRPAPQKAHAEPQKRNARFKKDFIDEQRFINKAVHKEEEAYVATHAFADFAIDNRLAQNLTNMGYEQPSPIQDQAIPVALTGTDIIGIAATGTGKTAAFLVPLIDRIVKDPKQKFLVLSPTRELAQQIEAAFKDFSKNLNLFSVSCVGGAPIFKQIRELRAGVHAVIGTPGRVKDLMLQGKINLKNYSAVVLDEADRMLDMGFIDDMKFILGEMPEEHQSMFFSATFSPEIRQLCSRFLKNPQTIAIKSRDTASAVEQNVVRARDDNAKIIELEKILKGPHAQKVIIFREMKRHVDGLADALNKSGFKTLALHGDMRNRERERAVAALSQGSIQAIIATDVAARGIDIKDVTLVINYDLPNDYDTYIHRIGRTGRANKTGHALTFVPEQKPTALATRRRRF